jgi:hypothetical protein
MNLSIVMEWETVLEGHGSRVRDGLAALRAQIAEIPTCETVICYDAKESTEDEVRSVVGNNWPGPLVIASSPSHLDYYQKKNLGFTHTSADVVAFLDSDLIAERDWLRNMLASFADFRVSVVIGRTHLETRTLYERAVALFWIFDARDTSDSLRATRRLLSNNFAIRRNVFKQFPFPDRDTFRGQCTELAGILESRRIAMYEQPAARACHPAPEGVRRFVARAFHAGSDLAFYDALENRASFAQCLAHRAMDLRHVRERIAERGPVIGATRIDRIAARVLGNAYYTIKSLGYAAFLCSAARPRPAADGRGRPSLHG